ncbi:unnamed protein product [Paramecium primaurelia]|uniref:Cullin family profile domain-containing protein n=1 Tax=Paramecium primaurelia TaxID=5886 RepID=A0A8S1L5Q9_PARPR|nr:unnamed protein product [Paramecium primaurelia]
MNNQITGTLEIKNQYQQQFEQIQQQCQEAKNKLKKAFQEGVAITISFQEIMTIYNNIYHLSNQANTRSPNNLNKHNDFNNVDLQLIIYFEDLLKEFINEIYQQVNELKWEKESTLYCYKTYHDYKAYSYWLYKMFYYLDYFIMPCHGKTIFNTSLKLFKAEYFDKCNQLILNTILQFIQETRKNGILLNKKIKQLIQMYSIMGSQTVELRYMRESGIYDYICKNKKDAQIFYEEQFQSHFLLETQKYYKNEVDDKLNLTTIEFINWANSIFKLEMDMCLECYPNSYQALIQQLKMILVSNQAARLVDSPTGLAYMLQYDQTDQLKLLFKYIIQIEECIIHISKYFEQKGQSFNNSVDSQQQIDEKNEAELYFTNILRLMEKTQDILQNQLEKEPEVKNLYSKSLMYLTNKHKKSPKFLAIYIDIIIRREKGINDIETDKMLTQIICLFQLLDQRDIFFQHYQKLLSKRLLNIYLQDLQLEKQILSKFKGETGTNIQTKLSTMIQDIEESNRFAIDQQISKDIQFEFNAILMTSNCWPKFDIFENIIKPLKIQNILENYEKLYEVKFKNRIVKWYYNLGQAELIYKIQTEKYFLNVNTMQMIVFLQFNKADSFSIKNILDLTNIDKIVLENSLIPFICKKIITREKSKIEDFSDENEVVKLNKDFTKRAKKIKLFPNHNMLPKRAHDENEENQQLNQQRELVVDSQLIRLMKIKKTIDHHELLQKCQSMISIFKPDQQFINNRIESLIERFYVARDKKNFNVYHYQN